jgi:thiol-disulfide isomerase/thioredoxin
MDATPRVGEIGRCRQTPAIISTMAKFARYVSLVSLLALTVPGSQGAPPTTQPTVQTLPASRGGQDLVGQPFPKLELNRWLNTPDGKPLDTAHSVTLYRFWTDTCPFCQATLPAVETLRKKYADAGLKVVAIYHPKPPHPVSDDVIAAAATERGYHGAVAIDPEWTALKTAWMNHDRRAATSASFLVDRQGIIRFVHPGVQYFPSDKPDDVEANHDYELLDAAIAALLVEKPTK